jgi:hypothetical protein
MRQLYDGLAARLTVACNEVGAKVASGQLEKDPTAAAFGASVRRARCSERRRE